MYKIEQIFNEEMKNDKSFQSTEGGLSLLIFGTKKYSQEEVKKEWENGIKLGIEIGLRRASLEGQRIEINHNTSKKKHKEFVEKFYKLADEYQCNIQCHPEFGMVILDREI